ncbi:alfa-L-arabinofuranosidase precursor [Mycena vulgaris]|nr:alfa-L-arabinofuranosidase precursor [Mycena vulgaris]KAJ6501258.1 alfa-L-arabinofuranosidase precursor [Mycena vulgaris]
MDCTHHKARRWTGHWSAVAVTVTVSATASHPIPTTLWGQMFEDISSGDGGLYAELLQNRAFQQVTPNTAAALNAWHSINGAALSVVADTVPVSSALPNSLQVTIPAGKIGPVGVGNEGYWGIKVASGSTYTASFRYRFPTASAFKGSVTVALQTAAGQALISTAVPISAASTAWTLVNVTLHPMASASTTANNFTVTLDGAAASGQTVHFALFSLFPPTFKNRPNGMRVDIATTLSEMGPSFFRLPETVAQRWQWNATVGPLLTRPGRVGDWGYVNSDGLGLMDYLNWCEDVGMQPIMAVWSGFALGGTSVAEAQLGPYIQQAIDQINFVIGDPAKSAPAALRASLGHAAPYDLNYVEVGNEDFFASSTYTYRWQDFVTALRAVFPNLRTSPEHSIRLCSFVHEVLLRRGPLIPRAPNHLLVFPTMQIFSASYAPLLNHVANSQWTPNLISFEYLFSLNRGDEYIPSTLPTPSGTLFWSVVRKTSTRQIIIKLSNTVGTAAPLTFVLPFATVATTGTAQVLTGAVTASNTPTTPNLVVPKNRTITTGKTFSYTAPGFSVSVLTLVAY